MKLASRVCVVSGFGLGVILALYAFDLSKGLDQKTGVRRPEATTNGDAATGQQVPNFDYQATTLEISHEANGPASAKGVIMRRASCVQIGFCICLLLVSSGLIGSTFNPRKDD